MDTVYQPEEDSYLLREVIRSLNVKGKKVLDMGTGSGILAIAAAKNSASVTAADSNADAVTQARKEAKAENVSIKVIQSNLFSNIKGTFDIIICNSPYLPAEEGEPDDQITKAIVGGKHGWEWCRRFLDEAIMHVDGAIYLLFSSKSKPQMIINHPCYTFDLVAEKNMFFEQLLVYRCTPLPDIIHARSQGVTEIKFLARGKHGLVIQGTWKKKKVAIKMLLPKAPAPHALLKECQYLTAVNKLGIGPQLYHADERILIMEFIEGQRIDAWIEKHKQSRTLTRVVKEILQQCRKLDSAGIEKQEMTHPQKHIIVGKDRRIVMIDFERCLRKEKPGNVTQVAQWLSQYYPERREIIHMCSKKYKQLYTDEAFDELFYAISRR